MCIYIYRISTYLFVCWILVTTLASLFNLFRKFRAQTWAFFFFLVPKYVCFECVHMYPPLFPLSISGKEILYRFNSFFFYLTLCQYLPHSWTLLYNDEYKLEIDIRYEYNVTSTLCCLSVLFFFSLFWLLNILWQLVNCSYLWHHNGANEVFINLNALATTITIDRARILYDIISQYGGSDYIN